MTAKAFIFDVFGTLVDWRSSISREVAAVFQKHGVPTNPHEVAVAWRNEYDPAMAPIRDGKRAYTNLDVLHRENLDRVLASFSIGSIPETEIATLARAWEKLDPWPDTVAGLQEIRNLGLIAPCSNGSIALMAHLARHAGIHWDCVLGAEIAQTYKPNPTTYLRACNALQLQPGQVMMIAAHNADLHAARAAGLLTGFVPRPNEHADPTKRELAPTGPWDVLGSDLVDLARQL